MRAHAGRRPGSPRSRACAPPRSSPSPPRPPPRPGSPRPRPSRPPAPARRRARAAGRRSTIGYATLWPGPSQVVSPPRSTRWRAAPRAASASSSRKRSARLRGARTCRRGGARSTQRTSGIRPSARRSASRRSGVPTTRGRGPARSGRAAPGGWHRASLPEARSRGARRARRRITGAARAAARGAPRCGPGGVAVGALERPWSAESVRVDHVPDDDLAVAGDRRGRGPAHGQDGGPGGLTTAVKRSTPNIPRLDTEIVEPSSSLRRSRSRRGSGPPGLGSRGRSAPPTCRPRRARRAPSRPRSAATAIPTFTAPAGRVCRRWRSNSGCSAAAIATARTTRSLTLAPRPRGRRRPARGAGLSGSVTSTSRCEEKCGARHDSAMRLAIVR